jgi:hypothetical protein
MTDFAAFEFAAPMHGLATRLRATLAARRAERDLRIGAERLAALSPHLVADAGLPPTPPPAPSSVAFGRT